MRDRRIVWRPQVAIRMVVAEWMARIADTAGSSGARCRPESPAGSHSTAHRGARPQPGLTAAGARRVFWIDRRVLSAGIAAERRGIIVITNRVGGRMRVSRIGSRIDR